MLVCGMGDYHKIFAIGRIFCYNAVHEWQVAQDHESLEECCRIDINSPIADTYYNYKVIFFSMIC